MPTIDPGFSASSRLALKKKAAGDAANAIDFPTQVSFKDRIGDIRGEIGAAPTVTAPTLGALSDVPMLGEDYWANLQKRSADRLRDQYFGSSGLEEKMIETLNRRGVLGSGIESTDRSDLQKSFGEEMAGIESDIFSKRSEMDYDNLLKRRDLQNQRDIAAGGWGLEAGMKNAELGQANTELAVRSALTDAAEANKFGIGKFEQEIKLEDVLGQRDRDRTQQMLDMLANPEIDLPEETANTIINSIMGSGGSSYGGAGTGGAYSSFPADSVQAARLREISEKLDAPKPGVLWQSIMNPYERQRLESERDKLIYELMGIY